MARDNQAVKKVLVVLFIPSVERDGKTQVDQNRWRKAAMELFGRLFGGATAYSQVDGIWHDVENDNLVWDNPVVVHCYADEADWMDLSKVQGVIDFGVKMGRDTHQGEVGLVAGDEYLPIVDFGGA